MTSSKYTKMDDQHQLVNEAEEEHRPVDHGMPASEPEPRAEIVPVQVTRDPNVQGIIYRSANHNRIVKILCILQLIMCGVCFITQLALQLESLQVTGYDFHRVSSEFYTGYWFAPLTAIPGVIGLVSAFKPQFRLVVVTLVLDVSLCGVIGAIFIVSKTVNAVYTHADWIFWCKLLVEMRSLNTTTTMNPSSYNSTHFHTDDFYYIQAAGDCSRNVTALHGCIIASMTAIFILGIVVSGFTCSATCCRPAKTHYMTQDERGNPVVYKSRSSA